MLEKEGCIRKLWNGVEVVLPLRYRGGELWPTRKHWQKGPSRPSFTIDSEDYDPVASTITRTEARPVRSNVLLYLYLSQRPPWPPRSVVDKLRRVGSTSVWSLGSLLRSGSVVDWHGRTLCLGDLSTPLLFNNNNKLRYFKTRLNNTSWPITYVINYKPSITTTQWMIRFTKRP